MKSILIIIGLIGNQNQKFTEKGIFWKIYSYHSLAFLKRFDHTTRKTSNYWSRDSASKNSQHTENKWKKGSSVSSDISELSG